MNWDTLNFRNNKLALTVCSSRYSSPSAFSRRAVVSYWRKYVHEVLVNRLGGLSLPRKSVVRLSDRPDMTLDVYRGRETTMQHLGTPKFQVYMVSFSDFKHTKNDRVGLLTDLNIHLIALFDPLTCKNDLMASTNRKL